MKTPLSASKSTLLLLFLSCIVVQCAKVPITGRSQASFVSNRQIIPASFQQYEEVKRTSNVLRSGKDADMVTRVGTKIQRAVEKYFNDLGQRSYLDDYNWEYILIKGQDSILYCTLP